MDTIDEADMVHLARFMETAITSIPSLKQPNTEKTFEELNASDDADLPNPPSPHLVGRSLPPPALRSEEDDVIHVVRENSKDFLTAIRSMSSNAVLKSNMEAAGINLRRENSRPVIDTSGAKEKDNSNEAKSPGEISEEAGQISANRENSVERIFRLDRIAVCEDGEELAKDLFVGGTLKNFDLPKGYVTPEVANQIVQVYKNGGKLSTASVHKLLRLAYRALKPLPNTTKLSVTGDVKLAVVGDIHGKRYFIEI